MSSKTKRKRKKYPRHPQRQRCAGCYQWTQQIGMIGYRQIEGGTRAIYIACPKCADRLEQNQDDPKINANIAAYLQDRIPADRPVGLRKIYEAEVIDSSTR